MNSFSAKQQLELYPSLEKIIRFTRFIVRGLGNYTEPCKKKHILSKYKLDGEICMNGKDCNLIHTKG